MDVKNKNHAKSVYAQTEAVLMPKPEKKKKKKTASDWTPDAEHSSSVNWGKPNICLWSHSDFFQPGMDTAFKQCLRNSQC